MQPALSIFFTHSHSIIYCAGICLGGLTLPFTGKIYFCILGLGLGLACLWPWLTGLGLDTSSLVNIPVYNLRHCRDIWKQVKIQYFTKSGIPLASLVATQTTAVYYIHGPWADEINFCCFYMCHSTMGLTRCYKMAVFTFITQNEITTESERVCQAEVQSTNSQFCI